MIVLRLHEDAIDHLRFSPDGSLLLSASTGPRPLRVSDAVTGAERWATAGKYHARDAVFTPDGRSVIELTALDYRTAVVNEWDAATGGQTRSLPLDGVAAAVTPDGLHLALAHSTQQYIPGRDIVWDSRALKVDLRTGAVLSSLPLPADWVHRVAVSPDGRTVAVRGNGLFALVDTDRWAVRASAAIPKRAGGVAGLAFAPGGAAVVYSVGPRLFVWDVAAGTQLRDVRDTGKHVQDVAFTPDGRHLLTVSSDATVKVREAAGWAEVKSFTWKIGKLKSVAAAPDGTRAACGNAYGRAVIWDLDL